MPFLTINGAAVSVASDAAEMQAEAIGERARAFDGTLRSTQRGVKRKWQVTTGPLTPAESAALQATLTDPADFLRCGGDLVGGAEVWCAAELGAVKYLPTAGGHRQTVQFTLLEA